MSDATLAFALPPKLTAEQLKARLGAHVALQMGLPEPFERVYYDTFDWRLYGDGLALVQDCNEAGAVWRLYDLSSGDDVARCGPSTGGRSVCQDPAPFFADRPPDGVSDEFGAALQPHTTIRALLPLAHVVGTVTMVRVFNKDIKTVVRVAIEDGRLGGENTPLPTVARLLPVRGYDRWLNEVRDLLAATPGVQPSPNDALFFAAQAAGRTPGDYSNRLDIPLDPADRADHATRVIHRTLLEAMQRNEPGVRADIDSEFLHEYRVAVRRTRSALSQIKDVLPEDRVEHFKTEFGWLGQMTGPTRDLDVYLLQFDDFRAKLPDYMREWLDPLYDHLARRQREEQAILVRALDTVRYAKLMREWPALLDRPSPKRNPPENAALPVAALANRQIWRAFRRTARESAAITAESPAEQVHELRKTAKKLRYLLEFYSALYPADDLKGLVNELKELQNILGEYQDLQVQIESLQRYGTEMQAAGDVPAATLMAIGALTGQLYQRELDVRQELMPVLAQFARPKLRRRFAALFGEPDPVIAARSEADEDSPAPQPSPETEDADA